MPFLLFEDAPPGLLSTVDGIYRASLKQLDAIQAAWPSRILKTRRAYIMDALQSQSLRVVWASSAFYDDAVLGRAENIVEVNRRMNDMRQRTPGSVLETLFRSAQQAALNGEHFHHFLAPDIGRLRLLSFAPVDIVADDGSVSRYVAVDTLPESPEHDELALRSLFSDRYSGSLVTCVLSLPQRFYFSH